MHTRGRSRDMYERAVYATSWREVARELEKAVARAELAGVRREAIIVDPGLGFAKRADHSFEVLAHLDELAALDRPILCGASRKSFLKGALGERSADAARVGHGRRRGREHPLWCPHRPRSQCAGDGRCSPRQRSAAARPNHGSAPDQDRGWAAVGSAYGCRQLARHPTQPSIRVAKELLVRRAQRRPVPASARPDSTGHHSGTGDIRRPDDSRARSSCRVFRRASRRRAETAIRLGDPAIRGARDVELAEKGSFEHCDTGEYHSGRAGRRGSSDERFSTMIRPGAHDELADPRAPAPPAAVS